MKKLFILFISLICLTSTTLEAKWWIFGGGEDEVGFDYLYVGNLSFDDVDTKAVLLTSSLKDGTLHVRGKARVGTTSKIGAIKISLDGAKTWKKAKFEKDGGFDFAFEPDLKKSYDIYAKVIDTSGKSNEIVDSHVIISFSDLDVSETIQKTLESLKNAYQDKNDNLFMQNVSSSFEGDDVTLERALRKDFSALDEIRIDFTLSSVSFSDSRYFASVSFNRHVITADGTAFDDSGVTEFTFSVGEKGAMLLSMKNPLIFGLSYAEDITSGTVASAQNGDTFLTISDDGTVKTKPIEDIISGSDSDYATSGSFTLDTSVANQVGFNFINDERTTKSSSDFNIETEFGSILLFPELSKIKTTAFTSLSGITVPEAGYDSSCFSGCPSVYNIGEVFAMKLNNNTYAVVQIVSNAGTKVTFSYKYNPGGSRDF